MFKKNNNLLYLGLIASAFFVSGCIPSHNRCFTGMEKLGYFCYKSFNYGRKLSDSYKKGIKDGCRTAEGHFVRNYSLSAVSDDYRKGWDAGRGTCKLIIPEDAKPGMRTQYQQDIDQKNQTGT